MHRKLGATIVQSPSSELRLDESVTHVVVYAGRTAKGLLARVSGRYVMSVEWVAQSIRSGAFVSEKGFGERGRLWSRRLGGR